MPAALYAVNNYLKFAMQLYFKPTTAKMLGNLKVMGGCITFSFLGNTLTAHEGAHACSYWGVVAHV